MLNCPLERTPRQAKMSQWEGMPILQAITKWKSIFKEKKQDFCAFWATSLKSFLNQMYFLWRQWVRTWAWCGMPRNQPQPPCVSHKCPTEEVISSSPEHPSPQWYPVSLEGDEVLHFASVPLLPLCKSTQKSQFNWWGDRRPSTQRPPSGLPSSVLTTCGWCRTCHNPGKRERSCWKYRHKLKAHMREVLMGKVGGGADPQRHPTFPVIWGCFLALPSYWILRLCLRADCEAEHRLYS